MRIFHVGAWGLAIATLVACRSGGGSKGLDAGSDAEVDAGPEMDAQVDAQPDAELDAQTDADSGLPPLELSAIGPGFGPSNGGTPVTLEGAGFAEGVEVFFGDAEAATVVVLDGDDTILQVTTPPGTPDDVVDVRVVRDDMEVVLEDAFTYTQPVRCRIASASPAFGADSVPVVAEVEVHWDQPLDDANSDLTATLRRVGSRAAVPAELTTLDDGVRIRPTSPLLFWSTYTLEVSGGESDVGEACEAGMVAFQTYAPALQPAPERPTSVSALERVGDTLYAVAPPGLQIYDVSDEEAPVLVGQYPIEAMPRSATAVDDRLYLPLGSAGVLVLDIASPHAPEQLGIVGTPGSALQVLPVADPDRRIIAIADGTEGVRIVHVDNLEAQPTLSVIDPSGVRGNNVRAIHIDGTQLFIADNDSDGALNRPGAKRALWHRYDITDVETPVLMQSSGRDLHFAIGIVKQGDYVFVGLQEGEVLSFAATDIDFDSRIDLAAVDEGVEPLCSRNPEFRYCNTRFDTIVADDQVVVANWRAWGAVSVAHDGAGHLEDPVLYPSNGSVDAVLLSDTHILAGGDAALSVLSRATPGEMPYVEPRAFGYALGIDITDDHIFVAARSAGIRIAPRSAPFDSQVALPTPGSITKDRGAANVLVHGDVLLVADGRAGLTTIDISDPDAPAVLDNLEAPEAEVDQSNYLAVDGNVAVVTNCNNSIELYDITDPAALSRIESVALGEECTNVLVSDGIVYVATQESITSFPLADTADMVRYELPGLDNTAALAKRGDYLYAGTSKPDFEALNGQLVRLQVIDVSDRTAPQVRFRSDNLFGVRPDIQLVDRFLFMAGSTVGVHVFDIADPLRPVLLGTVSDVGAVQALAVGDDELYAAIAGGGIAIIDTGALPAP